MALKETIKHLRDLLSNITSDLEKSDNGNKAASQRVRTGTVKLEKVAKLYRKESIKNERATKGTKKPAAKKTATKKTGAKKTAPKAAHHAPKHASKSKVAHKAKPKAKAHKAKARALSFKKPTAKLLTRKFSFR